MEFRMLSHPTAEIKRQRWFPFFAAPDAMTIKLFFGVILAALRAIKVIVCTWHSSQALLTSHKSHSQFILITMLSERSTLVIYSSRLFELQIILRTFCCLTKVSFFNWIFIYAKFHVIVEGIFFRCLSLIVIKFVASWRSVCA